MYANLVAGNSSQQVLSIIPMPYALAHQKSLKKAAASKSAGNGNPLLLALQGPRVEMTSLQI